MILPQHQLDKIHSLIRGIDFRLSLLESKSQNSHFSDQAQLIKNEVQQQASYLTEDIYRELARFKQAQVEKEIPKTVRVEEFDQLTQKFQSLEQGFCQFKVSQESEIQKIYQLQCKIEDLGSEFEGLIQGLRSEVTRDIGESNQALSHRVDIIEKSVLASLELQQDKQKSNLQFQNNIIKQLISQVSDIQFTFDQISKPFEITQAQKMKFKIETHYVKKFLTDELNSDHAEYYQNCFKYMLLRVDELQDLFKQLQTDLSSQLPNKNKAILLGSRPMSTRRPKSLSKPW